MSDMMQLQNNELSIPARSLVPLLRDIPMENAQPRKRRRMRLLRWNFSLDKDSVQAGIYEMWQRRLLANVRAMVAPKEAQAFIGIPALTRIIHWLEAPDGRFGADPIAGRNALLAKSLDEAVAELAKRFGADMDKWKLGAYHHALIPPSHDRRADAGAAREVRCGRSAARRRQLYRQCHWRRR